MDHKDRIQERVEALEHQTELLVQHTRTVERRLRWWRATACGVIMLGLLTWALPSGKAADAPGRGMAERMASLEKKLAAMAFDDVANEVVITGANLRIVNGLGATETVNGLGNLIVGYNEPRPPDAETIRTGSHNVVVGQQHNFSRFGGLVVGDFNTISGDFASVSGGMRNTASGDNSSVSGGGGNTASGERSSVSGGGVNTASGSRSFATGGFGNTASGESSSVIAGDTNTASGHEALVSGGQGNEASGEQSAVSGGQGNEASGTGASVSGGQGNEASGFRSSVSGGMNITQGTDFGWAAGSFGGTISGRFVSP